MKNQVVKSPNKPSAMSYALLVAAGGLMFLPPRLQATLRSLAGDFVRPGCVVWKDVEHRTARRIAEWKGSSDKADAEILQLKSELETARQAVRQREVQLARWQELAAVQAPPLFSQSSSPPPERLAQPQLIEAAVLGDGHAASWRKGIWLDQGKRAGLLEEALILSSSQSLLDVGRDARLSPEDAVLLGRSVIGKVTAVGRWTSTLRLVTDAEFRGRAQLVRTTSEGFVFGAKGILKGQGEPLCRLEGIAATEMVHAGDSVYTADRDGLLPTPLYYGEVTEATLPDRAREWDIKVRPVERPSDLTKVEVLRSVLNPKRVFAN
jgi:cell shape-determining protein MreC